MLQARIALQHVSAGPANFVSVRTAHANDRLIMAATRKGRQALADTVAQGVLGQVVVGPFNTGMTGAGEPVARNW